MQRIGTLLTLIVTLALTFAASAEDSVLLRSRIASNESLDSEGNVFSLSAYRFPYTDRSRAYAILRIYNSSDRLMLIGRHYAYTITDPGRDVSKRKRPIRTTQLAIEDDIKTPDSRKLRQH
jgi:hypothetical protein